MKLWMLKPIDDEAGPWEMPYDKMFGFVVRAPTQEDARSFAAFAAMDEKEGQWGNPWLNPSLTTCVVLTAAGEPAIVLYRSRDG